MHLHVLCSKDILRPCVVVVDSLDYVFVFLDRLGVQLLQILCLEPSSPLHWHARLGSYLDRPRHSPLRQAQDCLLKKIALTVSIFQFLKTPSGQIFFKFTKAILRSLTTLFASAASKGKSLVNMAGMKQEAGSSAGTLCGYQHRFAHLPQDAHHPCSDLQLTVTYCLFAMLTGLTCQPSLLYFYRTRS